MAITYKTLKAPETVEIAGIVVPKRGCLTIAEEEAMRDLQPTIATATAEMTPLQSDIWLKQQVVTILIRSRFDRSWTIEQTQADEWPVSVEGETISIVPDMEMLDGLFEFFMAEQRRHRSIEELEAEPQAAKKKK